jgi:hypothetical protein
MFSYVVIPAKAGIQLVENPRIAGQQQGFVRYAEFNSCWIPAFAGMTVF